VSEPPARPKIYHITHIDNLPGIAADAELVCDAEIVRRGGPTTTIGMSSIKGRRLTLPVKCHPGDVVGDYVPFYFCPRSVMLYLLYMSNHRELTYRGGQGPIIHLEADLYEVMTWSQGAQRRWAFTRSNAGALYTEFFSDPSQLCEIDWEAVDAHDWKQPDIKEAKQAEFLLHQSLPFRLISRVGVQTRQLQAKVEDILADRDMMLRTEVRPDWYY
jgi:hypothetical protein